MESVIEEMDSTILDLKLINLLKEFFFLITYLHFKRRLYFSTAISYIGSYKSPTQVTEWPTQ